MIQVEVIKVVVILHYLNIEYKKQWIEVIEFLENIRINNSNYFKLDKNI